MWLLEFLNRSETKIRYLVLGKKQLVFVMWGFFVFFLVFFLQGEGKYTLKRRAERSRQCFKKIYISVKHRM